MTLDAAEMWAMFVADEGARALRIQELTRLVSHPGQVSNTDLAELATAAFTVAVSASLIGVEEVGRLALVIERAAVAIASGDADHATLAPPLVDAGVALAGAFEELANPDSSGARVAAAPVEAATIRLQKDLPELDRGKVLVAPALAAPVQGKADTGPGSTGGGAPDEDATWVPQVDDDMIDPFIEECAERLEGLAQKLLRLEAAPEDTELVREIFRDLHTVKGSSGFVGLRKMNRLAHAAEDLVGLVRDGVRTIDKPAIDALLGALDGLREILQRAVARAPIDVDLRQILTRLRDPAGMVALVAAANDLAEAALEDAAPKAAAGGSGAAAVAAQAKVQKQTLRVDFEKLDLLMNLVGELVLGKTGLYTAIQGLGSLGRELESERRLARRVTSLAGHSSWGPPSQARAVQRDPAAKTLMRSLGEELGRVERVFHEVTQDLEASGRRIDYVTSELRVQVMKLRMLPIARVFTKYHRTVRELANSLGKEVRLELIGEDTELDKLLVEQLDDPLMHLVRNALDHGIEPPEARTAANKPRQGTLTLRAYHRGNQIVIEVMDDGGGISPDKLRKKAVEKGLLPAAEAAALDDKAALDIIFRPGFSTAARVTDVSGRGVGMDVVRETISRLKGSIEVRSVPGDGSTFMLKLPLTLAIIQVLLVRVAGDVFALPLDVVARTLTCRTEDVQRLYDRDVIAVDGRQVPLIDLAAALEIDAGTAPPGEVMHVILIEMFGEMFGLLCERLEDRREIVIKPLGDVLQHVECAAGATLIGDRCAIILDVPAVIQRGLRRGRTVRADAAASDAEAAAVAAAPSSYRILIAEDSDTIRESLRRLLVAAGYQVAEARDGAEAYALAQKERFDLVSTDVMMPNVDGYELTRRLRQLDNYHDVPIVMVTSRSEKIDRVRGFDAGVDDYIVKPHDREELLRAVHRHLR